MDNYVHNQIIEQDFTNQVELQALHKYLILNILQKYGNVRILENGDHPIQIGTIISNCKFFNIYIHNN